MAFFQSPHAKMLAEQPTPATAAEVSSADFTFTFSDNFTAATDKLELGSLPAFCTIVDYMVIPENLNGNATIGLMSGTYGDPDSARTVGSELFSATTLASTPVRGSALTGLKITPSTTTHRAIGFTNSADITGAANKKITLRIFYKAAH